MVNFGGFQNIDFSMRTSLIWTEFEVRLAAKNASLPHFYFFIYRHRQIDLNV